MINKVYLSIGTNMGNRCRNIRKALCRICETESVISISHIYRTKPYGYLSQPDFINLALLIGTQKPPEALLDFFMSIESSLDRKREIHWGPRTIDIDILLYNDLIINTPRLKIPHPDMQNRWFVLKPMCDIAPDSIHPALNKTIQELFDLAFRH